MEYESKKTKIVCHFGEKAMETGVVIFTTMVTLQSLDAEKSNHAWPVETNHEQGVERAETNYKKVWHVEMSHEQAAWAVYSSHKLESSQTMECGSKRLTISSLLFILLTLGAHLITQSHSKAIVKSLPGYPGQLPFKLETGYVGIGEKEEVQLFYYFVESERNPKEDPLLFYLTGGPGASAVLTFFYQISPLSFNFDNAPENITMTLNPNSWTKMANILLVDIPAGTGFSYATAQEASVSSDIIMAKQANEFLRKFAKANCHGNYLNMNTTNTLCSESLQRYEECISGINLEQILEPLCDSDDLKPYCREYYFNFAPYWANDKAVQQALNIRQGTIGKWDMFNMTIHYWQGKNDTPYYSYDIFSSLYYHKKLVSKNCRSLIFSGDHDMTFPYVGIEQWIVGLNLGVESRWEPFYGAGHSVPQYKPKEAMVLLEKWISAKTRFYSTNETGFDSRRNGLLQKGKGKGLGPNGGSGGSVKGKVKGRGGTVEGNGNSGDSTARRGRGSLAKRLMDLKEGLGGGGFVVLGGRSSR
uniref:Serine carboxypeptidase-like 16 n=1 Tax=Tanacetum cinerariifolium TaxID=118510 RepID=A0A6L2MP96_TANCI|nr:serine carboxypeptidase-like 16 [Tanacetum cinerariifolium]